MIRDQPEIVRISLRVVPLMSVHQPFVHGFFDAGAVNTAKPFLHADNRGFIQDILDLRGTSSHHLACEILASEIIRKFLALHVDIDDFHALLRCLGERHRINVSKPAGTKRRRIDILNPVGRADHQNVFIFAEAVHLGKQRGKRLAVLGIHVVSAFDAKRIHFIDKNNAWCLFPRLPEHVTDSGRSDADIFLDKIGSVRIDKADMCLVGHNLRNQCFAGSGRSHKKNAFGQIRAGLLVLAWLA